MASSTPKRHVVVVSLKNIEFLTKVSKSVSSNTRHSLTTTFVWPRTGFDTRSYTQILEVNGARRDYSAEDFCAATLAKETVQAPSAITFDLSDALSSTVITKLFQSIAKVAANRMADVVEKMVDDTVLSKVAGAPFDYFGALVASHTGSPLCSATLLLDDNIIKNGGDFELEFKATRDVYRTKDGLNDKVKFRKRILSKGTLVARATISLLTVE